VKEMEDGVLVCYIYRRGWMVNAVMMAPLNREGRNGGGELESGRGVCQRKEEGGLH
jgi:hypothetical protein